MKSQDGRELLHVFSTAAPLPPGNYSKFDTLRLLAHGGDHDKASKAIRQQGYGSRRRLQILTMSELRGGSFPVTYHVAGVLVAGQPGIIGGPAKSLKTTVAADMAVSIGTGEKFLGCIDVPHPAPVAFMSGESGLCTLQETFGRIIESKGLTDDQADSVTVCPETIRMDKLEDLEAVRSWLTDTGAKVLFLDPTYLMMPGADANNLMIQGAILDGLKALCQSLGVTLVLLHHTKKTTKNEHAPPQLHNLSWAGFQEFARQWVLLGRREKYEPGTGEHKLWLSVGGSAGHGNLWALDINEGVYPEPRYWDVRLTTHGEAKKASALAKMEDLKPAILAALVEGPSTLEDVKDRLHKSKPAVALAVAALQAEGRVEPVRISKGRGRKYDGYQLKVAP